MSTNPHHQRHRHADSEPPGGVRRAANLFARSSPFLDALWQAADDGLCITAGCGDCGALEFRRLLARIDGVPDDRPLNAPPPRGTPSESALARSVAAVDFDLLRLAPRWYDALDVTLFHLRDRAALSTVVEDWVRRHAVPARVLDLVLFRHARYGFPDERLADLWIDRCLQATTETGDEGLVESLILSCPERVGADPRALRAALEAAARSACVRAVVRRLGDCA